MNDVLLEELRSKFSQIAPSHVVTFVGATHVGVYLKRRVFLE